MPFFDENPTTPPRIARRLWRALEQNRAARRELIRSWDADVAPDESDAPDDQPLTTVEATIRPVGSGRYRRLGWAAGEPHLLRAELVGRVSPERLTRRRSLVYFAQHTDLHITDAQAPARLVGAQSLGWLHPAVDAAHRPHETMTTQVFDQLVRATNRLVRSPLSGAPLTLCVQGGDHTDNRTRAELEWWLQVLRGGRVTPNTGRPGTYQGVQRSSWPTVWNPDLPGADRPQKQGHPYLPGVLDAAVAPFEAAGIEVPVAIVFGNHDRIFSGTFGAAPDSRIRLDLLEDLLRDGDRAPVTTSALLRQLVRLSLLGRGRARGRMMGRGTLAVTPDPRARTAVAEEEFLERVLAAFGDPNNPVGRAEETVGTGLPATTWWSRPENGRVQIIGLDSSNHTDGESGRIGPRQRAWLEEELQRHHSRHRDAAGRWVNAHGRDRLVVIVSHHNSFEFHNTSDDAFDPGPATGGEELVELLGRYPNVVLWLNGHSHEHRITLHRNRFGQGGLWEVTSASVVAFGQQGRLFEIFDNGDGTLSVCTTVFDHAAPPAVGYHRRAADWSPRELASLARELAANDDRWLDQMTALGRDSDRNVELVVRAPFSLGH